MLSNSKAERARGQTKRENDRADQDRIRDDQKKLGANQKRADLEYQNDASYYRV